MSPKPATLFASLDGKRLDGLLAARQKEKGGRSPLFDMTPSAG
jgi:hypothetical protein